MYRGGGTAADEEVPSDGCWRELEVVERLAAPSTVGGGRSPLRTPQLLSALLVPQPLGVAVRATTALIGHIFGCEGGLLRTLGVTSAGTVAPLPRRD